MLLAARASMGMPLSSRTWSTPTWAMPKAAPPPTARPTLAPAHRQLRAADVPAVVARLRGTDPASALGVPLAVVIRDGGPRHQRHRGGAVSGPRPESVRRGPRLHGAVSGAQHADT